MAIRIIRRKKAVTPYNKGTSSGWSGSSTSKKRADDADSSGKTALRQQQTLYALLGAGPRGLTWSELAELQGWHHGTASGVLSVLHKDQLIYRLTKTRGRCKVYVHSRFVNDRPTEPHGRKSQPCPNCGYEG